MKTSTSKENIEAFKHATDTIKLLMKRRHSLSTWISQIAHSPALTAENGSIVTLSMGKAELFAKIFFANFTLNPRANRKNSKLTDTLKLSNIQHKQSYCYYLLYYTILEIMLVRKYNQQNTPLYACVSYRRCQKWYM